MATLTYKVSFIDDDFYRNIYNDNKGTAFITEWDNLQDEEKQRFIDLASTRIKRISDRPFIDLGDLELEQAEGVQTATSRMIDYWMEYGLDLNRISGSVSQGSFSASQTVPSDPDYIPENVYEVLQDVNMYTPVGYFREDDLYRADDEAAITYGVRFKSLERVKDITLDKTDAEKANKDLHIPTSQKVLEEIRLAKLSPFVMIGNRTLPATETSLPTSAEIDAQFAAGTLVLDDGTTLVKTLTGAADERVPLAGEAIRVILDNGTIEVADYDSINWQIDSSQNALTQQVNKNTASLDELNGLTQSRAIKATEGDLRYIRTDGSNDMAAGYQAANAKSVVPKDALDSVEAGLQTADANLSSRIQALEDAETLDDKVWSGSIPLTGSDSLSAIVDQNGDTFDFKSGKRLVVYIKHTGDNQGKSTEITVDDTAGGSITIPTGNQSDTLKIDLMNNGMLTSSVTNGNTTIGAYDVYRIVEAKKAIAATGSYSKAESDAKYQTSTDNTLVNPADKTVSGNINTNYNEIQTLKTQVNSIDATSLVALETKLGV